MNFRNQYNGTDLDKESCHLYALARHDHVASEPFGLAFSKRDGESASGRPQRGHGQYFASSLGLGRVFWAAIWTAAGRSECIVGRKGADFGDSRCQIGRSQFGLGSGLLPAVDVGSGIYSERWFLSVYLCS